jgi:hypothetical protein
MFFPDLVASFLLDWFRVHQVSNIFTRHSLTNSFPAPLIDVLHGCPAFPIAAHPPIEWMIRCYWSLIRHQDPNSVCETDFGLIASDV